MESSGIFEEVLYYKPLRKSPLKILIFQQKQEIWLATYSRSNIINVAYIHFSLTRSLARSLTHSLTYSLARKYAPIFVRRYYLFREPNSFPRAKLEENCELRGTDNVQGQIFEHVFAPNGDYCLYYPSNLFRNARCFENWGIYKQ